MGEALESEAKQADSAMAEKVFMNMSPVELRRLVLNQESVERSRSQVWTERLE